MLAATATVAVAAPALHRPAPSQARRAAPTAGETAQLSIARYFRLLDEGRGAEFCAEAISAAALHVHGGLYRCAADMSAYVRRLEQRSYAATLQDLHTLFMMVSDGIGIHCLQTRRCPSSSYGRWAKEQAPARVEWRTGADPGLASSVGSHVIAVVDPRHSSPSRITLYYQAWDGRILRASWSTEAGSWNGSVVDTHAGVPFISHVRVLSAVRTGPRRLDARVEIRVGSGPLEQQVFRLVREGSRWRADSWGRVAGPPAV